MNKKSLNIVFIIIILILVGIVFVQYKKSFKIKEDTILISPDNILQDNTIDKTEDKKAIKPIIEKTTNITALAKDEESLKSSFIYEVPLSKILDKKWEWVRAFDYDESIFIPKKSNFFSINFKKDGTFSGTTDCNSFFGKYTVKGSSMKLSSFGQTMMYCEDSEEIKFTTYLDQVSEFMFNGEEDLVLGFEFDSGSMIFKK